MVMEKSELSIRKISSDQNGSSAGENELRMVVESIDLPLRGLTVVRPVHSSVLHRSHCFQITTPLETRYFTCNSAEDASNWVAGLKEIIYPNRDKEKRVDTSLDVWLFEAKGLPSKKRYYCEIVLDKVLYGRTSTKLKSDILFWGEQFSFDDLPGVERLCLYVFRENDSKKKRKERSAFVGSVEVPLDTIPANNEVEQWLHLRLPGTSPRPSPKNSSNKNDTPSIRVKVKYQTVAIQPISKYRDLHEYIKQNYFLLCKELEPAISLRAKDDLAQTLLRILQVTKQAKEFLADIIIAEVNSLGSTRVACQGVKISFIMSKRDSSQYSPLFSLDHHFKSGGVILTPGHVTIAPDNENLTFRGNTLATKSMDTYMKMVGHKYLQKTFAQFIKRLYDLQDEFEVDPTKLTSGNLLDNQKNLLKLVEEAWARVLGSYYLFPADLQETFCLIKKRCEAIEKDVSVKLISGSIFLRFLCPAILSPSLFHLTREYPDEKTGRCLTLIAKALQNLANFTRFGGKEEYMESLNEFVERELPNMKNFLDLISSKPEHCEQSSFDSYIDIGRELAVISKLLMEQLPLLNEDSRARLSPLESIIESLKMTSSRIIGVQSLKVNDLEVDRLSPMPRSHSIPKESEHGVFRSMSTGSRPVNANRVSMYKDCVLSSAQDYVSGCSLIAHTPCKPKSGNSKRTKGRASDQKLRFWSNRSFKGQDSNLSLDQSNFVRSSSYHGRSSRDERSNYFSMSQSFDTGSNPNRSTASLKSDSRLKALSDPVPPELANSRSLQERSLLINDDGTAKARSNSFANGAKSLSASRLQDSSLDGDKTIRRLPDIIHELVSRDDITLQPDQPLYFSPATEPMTPLGNRNFKFGFSYGNQSEEGSLNSITDFDNQKHINAKQTNGDRSNNESSCEASDAGPLAIPISYNTWSSKSSDSDSLAAPGNYRISLQELNGTDTGTPHLRRNFAAELSIVKHPNLSSNSEMSLISPQDGNLDEGLKYKPHSDSILSGYSSISSDRERTSDHEAASICSNETCSCTCSEDQESPAHRGKERSHRRHHPHNLNDSFYDDRSTGQPLESSNEHHNVQESMERDVVAEGKAPEEYEIENASLRRQLLECQVKLRLKGEELAKFANSYEQRMAAHKKKLADTEARLRKQKKEKDEQMKSIISRLMNVEGELRKEQAEMQEVIEAKQHIIEVQEKRIKSLDTANRRLVAALTQLRNKYGSRNGTIQKKSEDPERRAKNDPDSTNCSDSQDV
eukprot:gene10562-19293_t